MDHIDYSILPSHMVDGVKRYVELHIKPGRFLYAVLCNQLVEAFGQADEINSYRMKDWAAWLYNEAPGNCWGSQEKVEQWISSSAG